MLQSELERLEHADLVRRAQAAAFARLDQAYWFKHGLVQETTYESLLKHDRKRLHRFVAEALENAPGLAVEELVPLLAKHWDEAGEFERALGYYVRAGDTFARVYANTEALMAYNRAIELSGKVELSSETLIHLYTARGRTLEVHDQNDAALANYAALETLAAERQDTRLQLAALMAEIPILALPNTLVDYDRAAALAKQALALAQTLQDRAAEAKILWLHMLLHARSNRSQAAVPVGEKALALARELNLTELLAYILNDLGSVLVTHGRFARGMAMLEESNGLWRALGNQPLLANNLSSTAEALLFAGEFDRMIATSDEAFHISEKIGNLWGQSYSLFRVGGAHVEHGEFARGMAVMRQALETGNRAGFLAPHLDTQLQLGMAYAWLGDAPRAVEWGERTRSDLEMVALEFPTCHAYLAEFYLYANDPRRAAQALELAQQLVAKGINHPMFAFVVDRAALLLTIARGEWQSTLHQIDQILPKMEKYHIRLYLADIWLYRSRALTVLGQTGAARQAAEQADTIAQTVGSKRIRWEILAQRAALEKQRGDSDAAQALLQQAREIIEFIAAHAPDELRETFLNRAAVQSIMS